MANNPMHHTSKISVQIIKDLDHFYQIENEWNELATESGLSSPFLSFDWFRCCLENFLENKDMCVTLFRHSQKLVGIAPFWKYLEKNRNIPLRKIGFITCPDTAYVDFIIHPDFRDSVFKEMISHFYNSVKNDWDVLVLRPLPITSLSYKVLSEIISNQRLKTFDNGISQMPFIQVNSDWDSFLKTRSRKFRKTRKNIVNRLERTGDYKIECIRNHNIEAGFRDISAVSGKSWKSQQGVAITSKQALRDFFNDFSRYASQKGWLMMWILKIKDVPVAMEYDLAACGTIYALRADFDENYKELSPGAFLEYQIIKNAFESDFNEYNTGPGLNEYKLHWTDETKQNISIQLCNRTSGSRLIWFMEAKAIPPLRIVKNGLSNLRSTILGRRKK